MKNQTLWISIIIIGIAGLVFAAQVTAPEPKPVEIVEPAIEVLPEPIETQKPTIPSGWKKIENKSFTINAPETWIINESPKVFSLASGVADDAYNDPDIVDINITKIEKNGKTLEEIVSEYSSTEKTADSLVELMQKEATPPYNEITRDDIKVSRENILLNNGQDAIKNIFQCLKICYIEGPAYTLNEYFVETHETIFRLNASTATTEKTETLLLVAEQVIKTFETK